MQAVKGSQVVSAMIGVHSDSGDVDDLVLFSTCGMSWSPSIRRSPTRCQTEKAEVVLHCCAAEQSVTSRGDGITVEQAVN